MIVCFCLTARLCIFPFQGNPSRIAKSLDYTLIPASERPAGNSFTLGKQYKMLCTFLRGKHAHSNSYFLFYIGKAFPSTAKSEKNRPDWDQIYPILNGIKGEMKLCK